MLHADCRAVEDPSRSSARALELRDKDARHLSSRTGRTRCRYVSPRLLEAGHRDAIFVVGQSPDHVVAAVERIAGIREALSAREPGSGQLHCRWWPEDSYTAVSAFLAGGGRPSAFICLNDRTAFGVYQAMSDAGLRIPEDVSIVSFDDSELASWLRPQLTSIAIPHSTWAEARRGAAPRPRECRRPRRTRGGRATADAHPQPRIRRSPPDALAPARRPLAPARRHRRPTSVGVSATD